ncbi:MAG: hypothetical protein IAF02_13595 [Anaerolineae bacterium]|nr:hypothetical protein [Anaerolineae bacterium]
MSQKTIQTQKRKTIGDAAVDGLLAGILAGVCMAAYLVLAGLLTDIAPAVMLSHFDPRQTGNWLTGFVAHLAVSAVYGVIFALLFLGLTRLRSAFLHWGWLVGLAYGLLLFGVAQAAFLTGVNSGLMQITAVNLLIAHVLYGVVLGYQMDRVVRSA